MEGYGFFGSGGGNATEHTFLNTFDAEGRLTLPKGAFLRAEFSHAGPDLLIQTPDGNQFIVPDYFMAETPPALLTSDGALMSAKMIAALAGPALPGQVAQISIGPGATDAGGANPSISEPIGQVSESKGQVTATRADGTHVALNTGDSVFQGDVLETASGASVSVVFVDDTIFSLDQGGRMVMDEMVYDPGTQTGTFNAQVVQGVFSFVSGQVAKTSPDGMQIATPTATIGIRGSTVVGRAAAEGAENAITLVRDIDGNVGELIISNGAGTVVLNAEGASTFMSSFNGAPAQPVIMPAQMIQQSFGSSLTNLVRAVSNKAQQDAQQTQQKAEQTQAEAKQADEKAKASDEEAKKAEDEAAQAKAEAEAAKEAAADDPEAAAKAAALEAKAQEAAQKAEQAKAEATAAKEAAAAKAQEAEAAQAKAEEAQQFNQVAQTALTKQVQVFEQVQQQQPDTNAQKDTAEKAQQASTVQQQGSGQTQAQADEAAAKAAAEAAAKAAAEEAAKAAAEAAAKAAAEAEAAAKAAAEAAAKAAAEAAAKAAAEAAAAAKAAADAAAKAQPAVNTAPGTANILVFGDEDSRAITGHVKVTDPQNDVVTYSLNTGPSNGTVVVNADGTFSYTPKANFNGTDVFTVTAKDAPGLTSKSTVTVDVGAVNDAPVAAGSLSDSMLIGGEIIFQTSHLSATDVDNTAAQLTYTVGSVPTNGSVQVFNGTTWVALSANGTFTQADVDAGRVKYVHGGGNTTPDSFTFTVSDGTAATAAQTLNLTISNTLTIASGQTYSITTNITASAVVNNGTLDASAGTISTPSTVTNSGTLNMTGGATFNTATLTNAAGAVINYSGSGHLSNYLANNGTINVTGTPGNLGILGFTNNGVLDIAAGTTVVGAYNYSPVMNAGSVIQGGGTFKTAVQGAYTYNGIWNPGTDGTVGSLFMNTWDANFGRTVHMSSSTVYNVDIAGTAAGQFDTLTLQTAYASTIAGTLNIKAIGGYTATSGDSFQILNYTNGSSGTFTIAHSFGAGWHVFANYGATALTVKVLSTADATTGTAGNDTLYSLAGNDTIDGGAGTDTLNLNSTMANYKWAVAANGTITLTATAGTDGTDTISNVETVKFTDGSITVAHQAAEQQVNTTTALDQQFPRIVTLDDGGHVIYWMHNNAGQYDMMAQRYDAASQKVGGEIVIASGATAQTTNHWMQVQSIHGGGFVASWNDDGGVANSSAMASIYDAAGTAIATNIQLNTYTTLEQARASVTQLDNGNLVFTWQSDGQDGSNFGVYARTYSASGTPIDANEFLVNTTTTGSQYMPVITSLHTGGYAIFWRDDSTGNADIRAKFFDAAGNPTVAEFVAHPASATDGEDQPKVATLNNGNVILTYSKAVGADWDVYATILNSSGGTVVSEFLVNQTTIYTQGTSNVAALDDGGFVIVWNDKVDNVTFDVMAQRFDANGTKVGGVMTINTFTSGSQQFPSVTGTFDGGFIVTWQSDAQDGDSWGIFSKRFDANGNELGYTTLTGDATNNTFNIEPSTSLISIDGGAGTDSVVLGGTVSDTNMVKVTNVETVTGGAAKDYVMLGAAVANSVAIDLGTGNDGVKLADGGNTVTLSNVENVLGGSGADIVTIATNYIAGDKANFDGGLGADTLNLANGGNTIEEIRGFETINGGAGADVISSPWGLDLSGVTLNSIETISIDTDGSGTDGLRMSSTTNFATGTAITGTGGNDAVLSNDGMNLANITLSGIGQIQIDADSTSANTVGATLTLGTQALPAGLQIMGSGDDTIAMAGSTLDLSGATVTGVANYIGTGNVDTLTLSNTGGNATLTNIENVNGGTGNDAITTNAVSGLVDGGAGTDTLTITSAASNISVANVESVIGSGGPDAITLTAAGTTNFIAVENITGSGFNDVISVSDNTATTIFGGLGNDTLIGGGGIDIITGGVDADTLSGGAGVDTFVYTTATDSNVGSIDHVTDFTAGVGGDRFDINLVGVMSVSAAPQTMGINSSGITAASVVDGLANSTSGSLATKFTGGGNSSALLLTTLDSKGYIAIDQNGDGVFDATNDSLIDASGMTGTLDASNFI